MSIINLTKEIQPGTFRWIGQRVQNLSTLDIPIGAKSIDSVASFTKGEVFRIGQISMRNAFVIERDPLRLLYVRRNYRSYRRAAQYVYKDYGWKVDYDHALGSKIAGDLGYEFVLLIRLTPKANRSHGAYEKKSEPSNIKKDLCFADGRIVDKWLGRTPHFMRRSKEVETYTDGMAKAYGLTLKQMGVWGFAMGVEDNFSPVAKLHLASRHVSQ